MVFVLIGLVALLQLPTAEYPNVVPPTIQVSTRYPGATAKTLVDTVALPIEQQVNGVEDMLYMQSTSASDGTYTLTVTFAIGTDPDKAQILVQNQVSAALSSLPAAVQAQGVTTAKRSSSLLEFIALVSPESRFDSLFLSNYAVISVQNELARLKGRRRRDDLRRRSIRHADLDESGPASNAGPDAAGRDQRDRGAEPTSHRRPSRRAACAEGPGFPIFARYQRPPGRCCRIREHYRQGR